jgi:8-amino-7-oxononanoate synthase
VADEWLKFLDERQQVLRSEGLARELKVAGGAGVRLRLRGRGVVSFASNDYLGLSTHSRVVSAAKAALDEFGAGATASPLICGNRTIHDELARALAAFKGTESALIFPSGFQAALATLGALGDESSTILLDKLSHASLIDGAKLSGARVRTFHHNDVDDLSRLLEKESARRCIVVIESLYSMDGDLAKIAEISAQTGRAGALLLVDEAHATGVLGRDGHGCVTGANDAASRTIVMGTLSKALGAQGGFVCASKRLIQAVVMGRAHLFSTGLAPASAAAALEALKVIVAEPERRERVAQHAAFVRAGFKRIGIETPSTEGPIVPALVGDEQRSIEMAERLFESGIYVPAVRYPTVKKGEARLRISVSAAHSIADCERLLSCIATIWK